MSFALEHYKGKLLVSTKYGNDNITICLEAFKEALEYAKQLVLEYKECFIASIDRHDLPADRFYCEDGIIYHRNSFESWRTQINKDDE